MRRTLMSLFVLTLALGLTACGDAPAATDTSGPTDAGEAGDALVVAPGMTTAGGMGLTGAALTDAVATPTDEAKTGACCSKTAAAGEGSCCDEKACADCEPGKCNCQEGAAAAVACVCKAGKAGKPVWCEGCDKGYVDGKEVCCPSCVKKAVKKAAGTEQ